MRIVKIILQIHEKHYRTYGGTKMKRAIENEGIIISLCKVYRLMRQNGIYTVHRYKHLPVSKGNPETMFRENILDRNFKVDKPNKVWIGDITYVKAREGWVYLAVILDLFNKEIVGRAMSRKPDTELVIRAMGHALVWRKHPKDVLFHSD